MYPDDSIEPKTKKNLVSSKPFFFIVQMLHHRDLKWEMPILLLLGVKDCTFVSLRKPYVVGIVPLNTSVMLAQGDTRPERPSNLISGNHRWEALLSTRSALV